MTGLHLLYKRGPVILYSIGLYGSVNIIRPEITLQISSGDGRSCKWKEVAVFLSFFLLSNLPLLRKDLPFGLTPITLFVWTWRGLSLLTVRTLVWVAVMLCVWSSSCSTPHS